MWTLRKFYGGQGGCLPPTDPRILSMTPEQIELEFEHIRIDIAEQKGNKEAFEDDEYDAYDNETEEVDRVTTDNAFVGANGEASTFTSPNIRIPSVHDDKAWEEWQ